MLALHPAVKRFLRKTPIFRLVQWYRRHRVLIQWNLHGRPVPPPACVKHSTLRRYGRRFGTEILVETGTFLGDTLWVLKDQFRKLYSIELSPELHADAVKRFAADPHVHLLQGDSAAVLPPLVSTLDGRTLFWLDGHFSGWITARGSKDTPIVEELETIFASGRENDVILIDDARMFNGTDNYPTIAEVVALVKRRRPEWKVRVRHDIIRVHG
jgi:hypothetical protein